MGGSKPATRRNGTKESAKPAKEVIPELPPPNGTVAAAEVSTNTNYSKTLYSLVFISPSTSVLLSTIFLN